MTTAIMTSQQSKLATEPKSELIHKLVRMKANIQKHKEVAAHAGQMLLGTVLAAAGGATAGVLAVKMPLIPRTKIPTDVAVGFGISLLCAGGVFDGADEWLNAFSHGLVGAGSKDFVVGALTKK